MTTYIKRRTYRILRSLRPAWVAVMVKRALRIRRVVVDTPQGSFWLDPVSNLAGAISGGGFFEPAMQMTLAEFLGAGKLFVDLGANEGYFTVLAAKLIGPSAPVGE